MNPVLEFESGYPTRLPSHPRLASFLRDLGDPLSIDTQGNYWILEWQPIFPGVPVPRYTLKNPWAWKGDNRKLVRVRLG